MAKRSKGAKRTLKRGPKNIWVCPTARAFRAKRGDADDACDFFAWEDEPTRVYPCEACPGPVKYVREDK